MARTIKLNHVAKVEGHARLKVRVDQGKVKKAQLEVFEGARYFEGILKGRRYNEAHVITSRICGVCSQAHTVAAVKAIEHALGFKPSQQTNVLRELLLIGCIIQSHALHLFFLALPDYYGYDSAIAMADQHPRLVKRGLKLKRLGNEISSLVGGREIHAITAAIGGFSQLPSQKQLDELLRKLKDNRKEFVAAAKLFSRLKYSKFQRNHNFYALDDSFQYSDKVAHIKCMGDKCIPTTHYANYFKEYVKPYSTAKFVTMGGYSFMVGALARVNLYHNRLCREGQKILKASRHKLPMLSPFLNNFAQALEMLHLNDRAIQLLENLKIKPEKPPKIKPKKGWGVAGVEVPRGTLFHEYELDDEGRITRANIITPTTQNLKCMEDDVKVYLPSLLDRPQSEIKLELEKLIRAYDPCISCSTHFLQLDWE